MPLFYYSKKDKLTQIQEDLVKLSFQISEFVATKYQYADIITNYIHKKPKQITINNRQVNNFDLELGQKTDISL